MIHLEAHHRRSLLHSFHGVLYLMDAALGTPCDNVLIILHSTCIGALAYQLHTPNIIRISVESTMLVTRTLRSTIVHQQV